MEEIREILSTSLTLQGHVNDTKTEDVHVIQQWTAVIRVVFSQMKKVEEYWMVSSHYLLGLENGCYE